MFTTFDKAAALALRFCDDCSGAVAIEYVVISAGMALTIVYALQKVGHVLFNGAGFREIFPEILTADRGYGYMGSLGGT